jgi:hypothetical protein
MAGSRAAVRRSGRAGGPVLAIAAAGLLIPLTATGAAQAATANPGTLKLSPGRAAAGDSADVFVFKYTAPAKPVPGTVSITVPAGFSAPQDTAARTAGYLSTSSSCASFQVFGTTTDNGAATVTLEVNCAAKGTGALVYEDVTVPTTAPTRRPSSPARTPRSGWRSARSDQRWQSDVITGPAKVGAQ